MQTTLSRSHRVAATRVTNTCPACLFDSLRRRFPCTPGPMLSVTFALATDSARRDLTLGKDVGVFLEKLYCFLAVAVRLLKNMLRCHTLLPRLQRLTRPTA